ncbi:polysaccharide deacetylase family protein [Chlamydia sp. 17-3921]|uniref:polysaccharide deacetylase family protein n=1 Tax=Chlamydia sp. 17-3921 TaxID=2675798 RepID=UPI0019194F62|nr:polysaccharide deacetylase family protein [Chlamydia sp. 17-3921]
MLIAFAFRHIAFSRIPSHLEALKRYLLLLKQHYPIILPGDPLRRISLILTFDFASIDFYTSVFPFLQQHQIPAVIGIAWRYVSPNTAKALSLAHRLEPSDTLAFQDEVFLNHMPFCSQEEILTMASSPLIQVASSGFAVRNLQHSPPYLATEVFLSKHYIKAMTGQFPKAFFYPFGKYDAESQKYVARHYDYSFILGNTVNIKKRTHRIFRLEMKSNLYTLPKFWLSPNYLKNWLTLRWQTTNLYQKKTILRKKHLNK